MVRTYMLKLVAGVYSTCWFPSSLVPDHMIGESSDNHAQLFYIAFLSGQFISIISGHVIRQHKSNQ